MSAGAACFVQTCDQVITGRQFQYDRSLEIIQEEEYLEDIDFDDIKRYDVSYLHKRSLNFDIPKSSQYSVWAPAEGNENQHYNGRYRKANKTYDGKYFFDLHNQTQSKTELLLNWKKQHEKNGQNIKKAATIKNSQKKFAAPPPLSQKSSPSRKRKWLKAYSNSKENTKYMPVFANSNGNEELSRVKRAGVATIDVHPFQFSPTQPPTTNTFTDTFNFDGGGTFGALGSGMVGMAMMAPNLNFQQGSPGGSAAAGTAGGGALPSDASILTAALSLALVPLGLTALAIFPPFATPRTVPAVAVIFSEARDMSETIRKREVRGLHRMMKKLGRASGTKVKTPAFSEIKHAVKQIKPKTVNALKKAWNALSSYRKWIGERMYNKLPGHMKKLLKKFARFEALLHKQIVCLKPRLKRRYGLLVYPEGLTVKAIINKKKNIENFIKHGDAEDAHVEYVEDCFDDMERPKFGWRVKVTLMESEPCDVNFENPEQSTCKIDSKSNGEDDSNYYAQSRQTGEGFRSAAVPDCRVEYVCDSSQLANQNRRVGIIQNSPILSHPVIDQPATAQPAQKDVTPQDEWEPTVPLSH